MQVKFEEPGMTFPFLLIDLVMIAVLVGYWRGMRDARF
jgi:hypothetical protein